MRTSRPYYPYAFRILLPAGDDQVVEFSEADASNLELEQRRWPVRIHRDSQSVTVHTGLEASQGERFEYCFVDPVIVTTAETEGVVAEAGDCIANVGDEDVIDRSRGLLPGR